MKLLILGASGMAGHAMALFFLERGHDVTGFSRRDIGLFPTICGDATDFGRLDDIVGSGGYDAVINCIGILNADAENNKASAVLLNSFLPHHLASVAGETETQVIQLSTDCVFSGAKGNYTEDDLPDGQTFYDRTKALGELKDHFNLTLRTSIIGPDPDPNGIGLFNWFMRQKECFGYTGSKWNGLTTLELARVTEQMLYNKSSGLLQPTCSETVSKYDLLCMIDRKIGTGKRVIIPVEGIVQDKSLHRSDHPACASVHGYDEMLDDMKVWIERHRTIYPHYEV